MCIYTYVCNRDIFLYIPSFITYNFDKGIKIYNRKHLSIKNNPCALGRRMKKSHYSTVG